MQVIVLKLKRSVKLLRGFLPKKLPVGVKDFDSFCDDLFQTYNLPDMPSYRHAIASMIMHLGPVTHAKAPRFFAKSIIKAMANQIAYERIQSLKKEEQAYIEATMAKPEVTPLSEPTSEPPVQDQTI